MASDAAGPYKDTVNLPITKFNMRANSAQREPQLQKFWEKNNTYEQLIRTNPGVGDLCYGSNLGLPASPNNGQVYCKGSPFTQFSPLD